MADTLEQDVHALKEWLRAAWRYLAEPSLTRFDRRELRNLMKEADPALRAGLQKLAARSDQNGKQICERTARPLPGSSHSRAGS